MKNQNFEQILNFVSNEFNYQKMQCIDIALTLEPYADNLFEMIENNKEMAKDTILHDFKGLFNHYGLNQIDTDFLPRLTLNK
jgi:hypothetical protein